jgi:hypothetical protein
VPDVSADAAAYAMYFGGKWVSAAGTSLAAPTWAALFALIDASGSSTCHAPGAVGFINPALYYLATSTPDDFNDITTGDNDLFGGNGGAYPATPGYDMASGLGSPQGGNLAQSFSLCGATLWSQPATAGLLEAQEAPSIAWDGSTLYAAFANGAPSSVYFEYYDNNDDTAWEWPVSEFRVDPGGTLASTDVSPAITQVDNEPVVAWTDAATDKVEDSTLIDGSWSPAEVMSEGGALSASGPAISGGGGGLYAAWRGHSTDNVYLDVNDENGAGWQAQLQVPGASTDVRPAIVWDHNTGSVVVAWTNSADKIQYEVWDSSAGFYEGGTVGSASTGNGPALGVVGDRLFEAHRGVSDNDIYFSSLPANELVGTWSPDQTLVSAYTLTSPALAFTNRTLFSAWTGICNGGCSANVYYSSADPGLPR